ncbi:MAG: peptide chain release factor 1 [Parcubacteria group bacterium]|nr:peptide chain release factor 1 [Parcubacteria group bacterium]
MEKKIQAIQKQYLLVSDRLHDEHTLTNPESLKKATQEYHALRPVMDLVETRERLKNELQKNSESMKQEHDEELQRLFAEEHETLKTKLATTESELKKMLRPQDPVDAKNVILEIRAGTGGDESTLFCAEMFRAYSRYAETKRWSVKMLSSNRIGIGGFKEIICKVSGKNIYEDLKYESGVHRVQRVPQTEKQGRVHTSTITVAVLPEVGEIEIKIDPKELRIDTFCSSGKGGQSVNTTYSAVRITHLPTNTVVSCQDERSQTQNKERAMSILRARLYQMKKDEQQQALDSNRKQQVGGGMRSEKIRTYNFPQDRITDHRIKYTGHNIALFMDGEIGHLIEKLKEASFQDDEDDISEQSQ